MLCLALDSVVELWQMPSNPRPVLAVPETPRCERRANRLEGLLLLVLALLLGVGVGSACDLYYLDAEAPREYLLIFLPLALPCVYLIFKGSRSLMGGGPVTFSQRVRRVAVAFLWTVWLAGFVIAIVWGYHTPALGLFLGGSLVRSLTIFRDERSRCVRP